ncbi:MAG: DsbA family oxidoreductase [Acidimicrobiia bacterium]
MKVEIWADIICPWCGLGSHRLEKAVAEFEHGGQIEVVQRSFQLDPSAPAGTLVPVAEMLQTRKGVTLDQVRAMTSRVESLAAAVGLEPFVVLDYFTGNTALAHELLAYAREQGRPEDAWAAMFRAYFGEARSIFETDSLVEIGTEMMALDRPGIVEALESRRFRDQVMADQVEAHRLGARGVPFIVVDRAYGISGAQPVPQLIQVLDQAWSAAAGSRSVDVSG